MIYSKKGLVQIKGRDSVIFGEMCIIFDTIYNKVGREEFEKYIDDIKQSVIKQKNLEHLEELVKQSYEGKTREKINKLLETLF